MDISNENQCLSIINRRLEEHVKVFNDIHQIFPIVSSAALKTASALRQGAKVLFFGNGGSAADSQHLAAELINRFQYDRKAIPAIALTTDSSNLTAISNDYSYESVFSRQIEALLRPNDVAVGITTSGKSANVLKGLLKAKELGAITIAFTGEKGVLLPSNIVDFVFSVPSSDTARIQEGHIFLGHIYCELIEKIYTPKPNKEHTNAILSDLCAKPSENTILANETSDHCDIEAKSGTQIASNHRDDKSYFVHKSSYVDDNVEIGKNTKIWHFSHIQSGARIGADCIIGQNVNIDKNAVVGNRVKIQNNVSVYQGVVVEDDVFLGPSMVFTNVINPRSHVSRKNEFMQTRISNGATIGANATIVCGHTIGMFAFVGAGAVVTKDIPDYALVVGTPARLVGWVCSCGLKLPISTEYSGNITCLSCSVKYEKLVGVPVMRRVP